MNKKEDKLLKKLKEVCEKGLNCEFHNLEMSFDRLENENIENMKNNYMIYEEQIITGIIRTYELTVSFYNYRHLSYHISIDEIYKILKEQKR